jgi:preprotein translocase subunit YajC
MPFIHINAIPSLHGVFGVLSPALVVAAAKKSSGATEIVMIVVLFAIMYFLLIRPQRQRRQRQMKVTKQIDVGDKVMLSSGIFGRVEGFVGDHARVEIAPGLVIEVVRQALAQRVEEPAEPTTMDSAFGSYGGGSHDDIVDDTGVDPYSVSPLEPQDGKNGSGGSDDQDSSGSENGGRGR